MDMAPFIALIKMQDACFPTRNSYIHMWVDRKAYVGDYYLKRVRTKSESGILFRLM